MQSDVDKNLVIKYNRPVPRYTSYPTVPFWKEPMDRKAWAESFSSQFTLHNTTGGISLYIHLPFCESLCTYCGCNKKITTKHIEEKEYLDALIHEWSIYLALMDERPVIRELHLGGGTPTFFSPANLVRLHDAIFRDAVKHRHREFSIEGHPNNTTRLHMETLYDLGFRRISFGVQDNDPEVQRIINRIQPLGNVRRVTEEARAIGYKSVNYDLIYGLPKQTPASLERTIQQTLELKPDRVAFYSYAHVPWTSRGQRLFDENDLPSPDDKMQLYLLGKKMFTEAGYIDIGMDHFALPDDDLNIASREGRLHRNFMGYTTQKTSMLLGLGVSSISDSGISYAQNEKTLHDYYSAIQDGELAVFRGIFLSEEDKAFKKYILDISCQGRTQFKPEHLATLKEYSFPELDNLKADGLVEFNEQGLAVTPLGKHFIRNICSAFDLYIRRNAVQGDKPMFSKAI